MSNPYEYYAFISYSHADEPWAKWVQRKLETYRFPSALRKKNRDLPKKIFPIFRDETDLIGSNLWDAIQHQLENSKYLIVICSPNSAKSSYVQREIEFFRSLGRAERIIPVIADGVPHAKDPQEECFCPALLNGGSELLGVDIKALGRTKSVLRIVATLTDLRFDALVRREKIRRTKRTILGAVGVLLVVAAILLSSKLAKYPEQAAAFAADAFAAIEQNNLEQAVQCGKESVRHLLKKAPDNDGVIALRSALVLKDFSDSNEAVHETFSVELPVGDLRYLGMLEDEKTMLFTDGTLAYIYDVHTCDLLRTYPFPQDENASEQKLYKASSTEGSGYYSYPQSQKDRNGVILGKLHESQKHQLRIEDGQLTLTDESGNTSTFWYRFDENGFRYRFNRNETIIALFDEQSGCLIVENLESNQFLPLYMINATPELIRYCMQLSPEGNFLLCMDINRLLYIIDLSLSRIVKTIQIGNGLWDGVVLDQSFDGFFYILSSGKITRVEYKDKAPQADHMYDQTAFVGQGIEERISSDNEIYMRETELILNAEEYQYEYHWTWTDIQTGELLFTANGSDAFSIDDQMRTYISDNGEIWSIREGKKLYADDERFALHAVREGGEQAASVDREGNVFLYDISPNGDVTKHFFLSMKKALPHFDADYPCEFIAFSEDELLVCGSYIGLYRFRLSDAHKTGEYDLGYLSSFDCIEDGLLFGDVISDGYLTYELSSEEAHIMFSKPSYAKETHLYCGSEYTDAGFVNTEFSVSEWKNEEFVPLYKYKADGIADTQFSDDGEYLILNIKDNMDSTVRRAVVLQAKTGEVLLKLPDCHVAIRNGIIYNISPDYVPIPLATSRMYSMDELVHIAKEK